MNISKMALSLNGVIVEMEVREEVVFETPLDMYLAIMKWEEATQHIAARIVGEYYTEECFSKSIMYWLDPKAQRWKQEFYNGFYGFRRAYFTKVKRICQDMLRSPRCGGKTVKYLKVFNPNTGMLEMPEGFQDSDILVDHTTLPKPMMLKGIMEEIRGSLDNGRDKQIFEMVAGGLNNAGIAEKIGLSEKTIRNRKSTILNTIRYKYKNGEYEFKVEEYTALDRKVGRVYYNSFFSNFLEIDISD